MPIYRFMKFIRWSFITLTLFDRVYWGLNCLVNTMKNRVLNCHSQWNMKEISHKFRSFVYFWLMKYILNAYSLFKNGIKQAVVLLFKMMPNWIYVSGLLFPWFHIEHQEIFYLLHNFFKAIKYGKKNKSNQLWHCPHT